MTLLKKIMFRNSKIQYSYSDIKNTKIQLDYSNKKDYK